MDVIYHCFRECNNSLAMYFLTAEWGFMKTRKKVMQVAEAGSDQWKGVWWSKGRGRDEVSNGMEMEIEGHREEKELMNLLQLQGFSEEDQRYGFVITVGRSWQNLAFEPLKQLQILSI